MRLKVLNVKMWLVVRLKGEGRVDDQNDKDDYAGVSHQ
jgi:hypothetical protein